MYVIFPALDVVDESYLALKSQENENPPATGLRASPSVHPAGPSPAPPTFHDTRPEQERAEFEIARQNAAADAQVPIIPHLTQLQPPNDRRDIPDSLYLPQGNDFNDFEDGLPDLVPASLFGTSQNVARNAHNPDVSRRRLQKVNAVIPMANSNAGPLDSQADSSRPNRRAAVPIRDLIHPSLNEPLKSQQQVTFKLIKSGKHKMIMFL